MPTERDIETDGLTWVELTTDDVLVGVLNPDYTSRLGCDPDEGVMHADLDVAPDATGRILLRVPDAIAPESTDDLCDLVEVWEPRYNDDHELVGARGLLHYRTRHMPWGAVYLEIVAEEAPFG